MRQLSLFLVAVALALVVPCTASAISVVNIDFSPAVDASAAYDGVNKYSYEYTGVGAALDAGVAWNHLYSTNDINPGGGGGTIGVYYPVGESNVSGPTPLVDSLGNATNVSASFNAGGAFAVSDDSDNLGNPGHRRRGLDA